MNGRDQGSTHRLVPTVSEVFGPDAVRSLNFIGPTGSGAWIPDRDD